MFACYPYLCLFSDGFVDYLMIGSNLFFHGVIQICHAGFCLLQIDVAQSSIEQDFTGEELEFKPQLIIVDEGIASQVEESVVEVCQCFLEVTNKEIGDTLLEICYSKKIILSYGSLITFDLHHVSINPMP